MKIAFIHIDNSLLFKEIKDKLNPQSYVECGGCGAIMHDDSWSLARIMNEKREDCWDDEKDWDETRENEEEILSEMLFQLIECGAGVYKEIG